MSRVRAIKLMIATRLTVWSGRMLLRLLRECVADVPHQTRWTPDRLSAEQREAYDVMCWQRDTESVVN